MSSANYGIVQPAVKPYPAGANSPATAGIAIQNANINKQMSLIGVTGGKKHKKRGLYKKGGATIIVPQIKASYPEPGAGNQTVSGNALSITSTTVNGNAQKAYDGCIGQPAGSCGPALSGGRTRRYKKGGVKWGCMSGGKKRYSRKSKHSRKNKSRKHKK